MILETPFNNVELISANHLGLKLMHLNMYKGLLESSQCFKMSYLTTRHDSFETALVLVLYMIN